MIQCTVAEAVRHGAARLTSISDNPVLEARLLLAHALGVGQTDLIRDPVRPVQMPAYERLLARRIAREPIALIVGRQEFWSMNFEVSPATLIPRADSETLVEAALDVFSHRPPPRRILDLGTGTGCLLLALLREFPASFGVGVDIDQPAASLAKRNAHELGLTERAGFIVCDWTNALSIRADLIVSNPPYIASAEISNLSTDIALYEPRRALDGGADGAECYRAILPQIRSVLAHDGVAILELGAGQAHEVGQLARDVGFGATRKCDLAGIPRVAILTIDSA